MLPVLLDLKFIKIYTYGVFLVLAFFWGSFMLWKNFRLSSYKEEDVFDGLFLSLAGGLFLGRVMYVALHFDKFGFDVLKFILINGYPGLSLYGFVAGGLLTLYLYLRNKKIKFSEALNYLAPAAFLALGFGKLGAFFAGTEIGVQTKFPLSIKYFGHEGARHLTPFYESLLFFGAFYISYKILFAVRRGKYSPGFNFTFFVWVLAFVYFAFDVLKQDRAVFWRFSVNGVISMVLLLTFSCYFLYYFRTPILAKLQFKNPFHGIHKSIHRRAKKKTSHGEGEHPEPDINP